ncbi:hypothetical protein C8R45DRAFT_1221542 [Mycena sanguinolenta]|nr:hypothetical protein C8R45DRAFT_1221542 [Mycena sanguinolenta]
MRTVKMPLAEVGKLREEEHEGVFFDEMDGNVLRRAFSVSVARARAHARRARATRACFWRWAAYGSSAEVRIDGVRYLTTAFTSTTTSVSTSIFPAFHPTCLLVRSASSFRYGSIALQLAHQAAPFRQRHRFPLALPEQVYHVHLRHARVVLSSVVKREAGIAGVLLRQRRRQGERLRLPPGGGKLALAVVVVGIQLGEESVPLDPMGWGRQRGMRARRLVRPERECKRQREAEREGKAKEGTLPFPLEGRMWVTRLCVDVGRMRLVGWGRAVQTNRIDGASAVIYLAAFSRVARLHRVIVLTLHPPSCSSPTFSGAAPSSAVIYVLGASLVLLPVFQNLIRWMVLECFLHIYICRRCRWSHNADEKTVVDAKKTTVIHHRPPEAREMLVEVVGELCEEEGAA